MKRSVVVKNTGHTALVPLGAPVYEHVIRMLSRP